MEEQPLETVLRRLEAAGLVSEARPCGTDYYSISCPFAKWKHKSGEDSRPSATVSFGEGRSIVRCHSCGTKMTLDKVVAMLNDLHGGTTAALAAEVVQIEKDLKINIKPRQERKAKPINDYMEILRPMLESPYPRHLKAFLAKKNIPLVVAQKFYCAYVKQYSFPRRIKGEDRPITTENALLFPVLIRTPDQKIKCVGAQVRPLAPREHDLKYYSLFPFQSTRFLFGEHLLHRARRKKIFLVEGGLDTMHIWSERHVAFGLLGLYMSSERAKKIKASGARKVYIMLDPDQNDKETPFKIQENLGREGVEAVILGSEVDPKQLLANDLHNF
jgi:hypothetical protein